MNPKNKIIQDINYALVCKLAPSKISGAGVGVFAVSKIEDGEIVFSTTNNQFIFWSEVSNVSSDVLNYIKQILLLVLPTGVGKTVIVPKLLLHYFQYKSVLSVVIVQY